MQVIKLRLKLNQFEILDNEIEDSIKELLECFKKSDT